MWCLALHPSVDVLSGPIAHPGSCFSQQMSGVGGYARPWGDRGYIPTVVSCAAVRACKQPQAAREWPRKASWRKELSSQ